MLLRKISREIGKFLIEDLEPAFLSNIPSFPRQIAWKVVSPLLVSLAPLECRWLAVCCKSDNVCRGKPRLPQRLCHPCFDPSLCWATLLTHPWTRASGCISSRPIAEFGRDCLKRVPRSCRKVRQNLLLSCESFLLASYQDLCWFLLLHLWQCYHQEKTGWKSHF